MKRWMLISLILIFLLAGCNIPQSQRGQIQSVSSIEDMPDHELSPVPTPTPVKTNNDPDPVRLILPTPGSYPNSLWRPPLNEAPWALSPYDHFYFIRPIAVDEVNWPLADYRYGYYFPGTTIVHTGIDIDANRGTPILAAAPGKVIWAGYGYLYKDDDPDDPYGQAVAIYHDFGYNGRNLITVYAHMDRVDVIPGQRVETGSQLGLVGDTGNTTGPHLHFEIRIANENDYFSTRNPELWLVPPQEMGILVGRLTKYYGSFMSGLQVKIRGLDNGKVYWVETYQSTVNSDDYYRENLVLGDLPSGKYKLIFTYKENEYQYMFQIYPGAITYFTFQPDSGFNQPKPGQDNFQMVFPEF